MPAKLPLGSSGKQPRKTRTRPAKLLRSSREKLPNRESYTPSCGSFRMRSLRSFFFLSFFLSFAAVYGKDKKLTLEHVQAGAGSLWTWTAPDADTKLMVSYMLGSRGSTAQSFMPDVAGESPTAFHSQRTVTMSTPSMSTPSMSSPSVSTPKL